MKWLCNSGPYLPKDVYITIHNNYNESEKFWTDLIYIQKPQTEGGE